MLDVSASREMLEKLLIPSSRERCLELPIEERLMNLEL